MIRAAVIGVGAMGRNHARVYNDLNEAELVAVADANLAQAEAVAGRLRVPAYTDVVTMLERERPAVVSIAVPTSSHCEVAMEAIRRGVGVLIEKPISDRIDQAQAVIAMAEERGVCLAVGHVERFNAAILELQRRLANGELGQVFQLHAQRLSPFPQHIGDVGVVMDLATHELDIMRALVGADVEYLFAETRQAIHETHEDLLSCVLHFSNGVTGVIDINWLTPTKVRQLRVTGTHGMFTVDYLLQDLYFFENSYRQQQWDSLALFKGVGEGNMLKVHVAKVEPLWAELTDVVAAVAGGRPPTVSGREGLRAIALAQAILVSGRERRVVDLAHPDV